MVYQGNLAKSGPVAALRPGFVLVVDDEPFFAGAATEMLLHAGYLATFALDPKAALRELETNPDIDLLLTDIVMRGMDGFTLAQRAQEIRPGIRVIYSSSHIELARSLTAAGDGYDAIIEKPFRQDRLIDAIKIALAPSRPVTRQRFGA